MCDICGFDGNDAIRIIDDKNKEISKLKSIIKESLKDCPDMYVPCGLGRKCLD